MKQPKRTPYIAGFLAGVLLVASVALSGHFLGASTTYARGAAYLERAAGVDTSRFIYFSEKGGKYGAAALPDWQLMFVIGIAVGAFIASIATGTFRLQLLPDMWRSGIGRSFAKRSFVAFLGGVLVICGARLAGGCPSGHGLSGLSQLAVSGFIALGCFFFAGMVTAGSLYGKRRR
jgi:uncharacterized membrane protein YedE/YeeE